MKIYPPNKQYPYWHYKCGIRAWRDTPIISRIILVISIVTLIISYKN